MNNKIFDFSLSLMRIALGIIFLWFGLLKILAVSPVQDFVKITTPLLGSGIGWQALGIFEVIVGLGLMIKIFPRLFLGALILHMIGTFSTFLTAPEMMFNSYPWLLTFEGEFVVKNLILAIGALIVIAKTMDKN